MAYVRMDFPEFSWSKCREGVFNECLQKYLFQYYTSHNGWEKDASDEAKTAYMLKNLESIHITLGSAIHNAIKKCIVMKKEQNIILDSQELIDMVRNELNEAYLSSKNREEWEKAPNKIKMLHEIYYDGKLDEEEKKVIRDKILICITNFFNSKTFSEIMNDEEIEFVEIDDEGFNNYIMLNGNKTYAKLDLLYRNGKKGKWFMVDWKTGKLDESDIYQAEIYALYIKEKYGVNPENVEFRMEYLLSNDTGSMEMDAEHLNITRNKIEQSLNHMKQYLEDVNTNKPLPSSSFGQSTNKYKCKKCNYRQICDLEFV